MTNTKRPSVSTVIGNDSIINNGLISIFTRPKTIAVIIAPPKLLIVTPGQILALKNSANAVRSKFSIKDHISKKF